MDTINRNGLEYEVLDGEETGRVVGILVTIAPDATLLTPHKRKVRLTSLVETIELDMVISLQLEYYTLDDLPMAESIAGDETLSDDARMIRSRQFAPATLTAKSTANSWVDPETGDLVEPDTEGAIPESMFYQSLTKAHLLAMGLDVADENRLQHLRFAMVEFFISNSLVPRLGL